MFHGLIKNAPRIAARPGALDAKRAALLGLTISVLVLASCSPSALPPLHLRSTETSVSAPAELCEKTERCIIVFLSPWCPDCRASVNFIRAMRERLQHSPRIGLRVIVGSDRDRAAIDAMAKQIGGNVYLDYDREFQYAARVIAVPHWFVLDEKRQILEEIAGSPRDSNQAEVLWWLENQLKVGPFVDY